MADLILYDVADGIGTITINRPEKRNAMTYAMLGEFIDVVRRAGSDDAARAIVLTGSGGSFCAGTDLSNLAGSGGSGRPQAQTEPTQAERDGWWFLSACPKPVVAAIDGPAVGMGAEFTSQCDVRIASTNARFAWNFVHRGLVPDTGAGTWLLPRLIGLQPALRLVLSGEFLDAQAALELGYVSSVAEPENLLETARDEARRMMAGSPFAQRLAKELIYQGLQRPLSEHLAHHGKAMAACFASEDHKEGVAAFLERRQANFVGR